MKRIVQLLLSCSLVLSLCGGVSAEETEEEKQEILSEETAETEASTENVPNKECEWNVMIYLCGTDLESKEGLATQNLKAIADTLPSDEVNLLVQTGGAKEWDPAKKLGFDIANDRLQRWSYGDDGFVLMDEVEDASMADGRTLTDFIQWTADHYSAKKNMLVLWDHGGGSSTGLILDENYGDTIMPVFVLEEALQESGTHFDLILTDTCLMASLEMCQALAPNVDYLAASEEVLAGDGTDYKRWIQYLYDRPECSPVQLGKRICDYSQQYYMEAGQGDAVGTFTMSLIDLSKIDAVAAAFNTFMHDVADLVQDPEAFYVYANATHYAENYLLETMYDLFDLSRRAEKGGISLEVTHAVQDAVEDAVLYNLRSENHMYSHGLSVYYPLNDGGKNLDHFARTCKNPEELAFLDCISMDWTAPDWVYQTVERRPELNRSSYSVIPEVICTEDGEGVYLKLRSGNESASYLSYELFYEDPTSGILYTLGESGNLIPEFDEEEQTYRYALGFDGTWPTLEGKALCMSIADDTESFVLYNVPVEIYGERMQLRVLFNYEDANKEEDQGAEAEETESESEDEQTELHNETDGSPYQLLGVWDGFDAHTGLPGRNSSPLSHMDDTTATLPDVVYSQMLHRISDYINRKEVKLTKDTVITRENLPKGEYRIRFVVRDVFNAPHYSDFVSLNWDGNTVSDCQVK